MNTDNNTGQRKVRHAREHGLMMLCGFLAAAYMKAPSELFVAYVAGLTGLSGAFVWGNVKEHQAEVKSAENTEKK